LDEEMAIGAAESFKRMGQSGFLGKPLSGTGRGQNHIASAAGKMRGLA
jgi:hypothetical protein